MPLLPFVLVIEALVLLYENFNWWWYDMDRVMREEGWIWSRRIGGLVAQTQTGWAAGAVAAAGNYEWATDGLSGWVLLWYIGANLVFAVSPEEMV